MAEVFDNRDIISFVKNKLEQKRGEAKTIYNKTEIKLIFIF